MKRIRVKKERVRVRPNDVERKPADSNSDSVKHSLLVMTLQLAVPLWIEKMRGLPWESVLARAQECGNVIASKGDIILYRSEKKGETAEAFNRLAEGIACLSFCPGGVKIFGSHWEACLDDDGAVRSGDAIIALCNAITSALNEGESP